VNEQFHLAIHSLRDGRGVVQQSIRQQQQQPSHDVMLSTMEVGYKGRL
jgi:hypothetical protein